MERTRSALARHRKRRLLEATQHVSTRAELEAVVALASVTSALHAHVPLEDAVNDTIRVLRNTKNSVYHRGGVCMTSACCFVVCCIGVNAIRECVYVALAARSLGLLVMHNRELSTRLCMESEELVDALLQIVNFCRHSRVQNADTRRIHVNCCLVISLVMQAPHKNLQLLVSLDSELLTMQEKPSERNSAFLFLTVSGRPESGAQAQRISDYNGLVTASSENNRNRSNDHRPHVAGNAHSAGKGTAGTHRWTKEKPPKAKRKLLGQQDGQEFPTHKGNQESPSKQSKRVAWESSTAATVGSSPREPLGQQAKGGDASDLGLGHKRRGGYNDRTSVAIAAVQSHSQDATVGMASAISSRQTPLRVFKMERFQVITPAFVISSLEKDPRLTPLPLIRPTRDVKSLETTSSGVGDGDSDAAEDRSGDDDARIEGAPAVPRSVTAAALLHPKHMLEVFRTKQMPLASPAFFKWRLKNDSEGAGDGKDKDSRPPPSRLQVLEWSEWKQKGLTEETAAVEYANVNLVRPSSPLQNRILIPGTARKKPIHKRAVPAVVSPTKSSPQSPATLPVSNNSSSSLLEERVEDLNTPEYKQKRLREILSTPVEPNEANAAHLRSLAKRVNTSFMVSLGAEIEELRREEMAVRSEMHTFIQAERDQLPLKFLFQLPGGAAYCRHRMRRAMALWVLEFEDNQRRMALLQWKAFVEHCRFQVRGKEYQRAAAKKRLQVAIEYVLRGYLSQALTKWVETTQVLIWVDRDHAARKIQVQVRRRFGKMRLLWLHDSAPIGSRMLRDMYLAPCRHLQFQIPPRIREERREIWSAAELVQSAYRRRRFRVFLARYRAAAAKIQAQQRMRAARIRYRTLRRRIIAFQAYVRMLKHFNAYQKLRAAVVLVQTTFRSVRIRRLRRLVVCAQRQRQEYFLSRVLLTQRLIRGFLGRRVARSLRKAREEEFNAALVVQRAWYRRNNEWSTFLLLGCLRMKENEEIAFAARVLAYKRNYMARQIQRAWLAYYSAKKNAAVLMIQCNYRRHVAQRFVQRMRARKMAHRRIKWFFRVHHAKRIRMATFLQFWWLKAVPGRLASHLRQRRLTQERSDARALYFREASAAARMQALVRGYNDRVVARRERSARKVQRAIREFLLWRRIKYELLRIKALFAKQAAFEYVATGFEKVYSTKMKVYNFAATQIQRFYRGTRWRSIQTQGIVSEELRTRMAIRVQSLWRFDAHRRTAKKLLQAQKRKLTNPFREYESLSFILKEMLCLSSGYFDPEDDLKGMAMPTWLHRLGLESKYLELFQKSSSLLLANGASGDHSIGNPLADALATLQEMESPDACRRHLEVIGIEEEVDLELMVTNLFAKQTIDDTKKLRDCIASARAQQVALKRNCDLAQMNLQKLEERRREAEAALEDVLDEMKDFRNPPNALRRQREKCGKELENALKSISDTQLKSETCKKQCKEKELELIRQQQEFVEIHEPREISALYSQQSLKLVSNMNSIREMYLARFPGLETRALSFVNALDPDQVTTWQLEQFFQTHTSVSAVKANMKELTYFALETEMKKLDHVRFTQCADILQYGYERMCELLEMPIEVIVLAKREGSSNESSPAWGMIHQELLDTLCSVRKASKVGERARLWRQGVDTLLQMNKTALGVQSMWRRRAAKKLMVIVRNRRGRERILAEYVTEAQTDHVAPIWEAERKKEQEELDKWLEQEAREQRLELLHETIRFPYKEEWNETAQMYYYYYDAAGEISKNGGFPNRQYATEGKPIYTIEEEDATIVLQAAVRAFLARCEVLALQRKQRRLQRRSALETEWSRTKEERSQIVTLKFRLKLAPNGRIVSWLKHRKLVLRNSATVANGAKSNDKKPQIGGGKEKKTAVLKRRTSMEAKPADDSGGATTESQAEKEADESWKKQMDAMVDTQLAPAYNRSVRAENRKDSTFPAHSRPPNAHGQAIIGLLNRFQQFKSRLSPDASTDVNLRFTKVELRFGWKEVRTGDTTRAYYYNETTSETMWDRPEYTFDDEYAAIKMQSIARMLIAKNMYASELDAISFVDTVRKTVHSAAKVGWIGFGLEGITPQVYLSRFGLSKYSKEFAKASIEDIQTLSEAKLKKLAWTKEEIGLLRQMPVQIRKKYPLSSCEIALSPSTKHHFNFLSSERLVSQIVSQSLPNQQGRVLGLVRAIKTSTTPISFRQLEMHLRKFAGRPDEALSSIGEIANLEFATREPQEKEICRLFLRCVERCVVFAANLSLSTLQGHLSAVLRVVRLLLPVEYAASTTESEFAPVATTPMTPLASSKEEEEEESGKETGGQEVERYKQAALARYPLKIVKGLWEQDPSKQSPSSSSESQPQQRLSIAQIAYYLREEALERVLLWVRSALLCQATFRMYKVRQWYMVTQAFRAYSATQIQCAWRVRCALELKALLESQQQSNYEQCYDKSTKSFFFVYTPTQEKLLDEPRDETGAITAFRPMVQDRVTKCWVRCWPHYDKKKSHRRQTGMGGDGGDDDSANDPPCSICNAERAARRCNECYSASGDYVDFCLVCFYDCHALENPETSWHSYQTLHRMKAQFFHCVECRRFSSRRCLQCDENYCERCFQRVHGKGHKRTAHKCELYDPMAQICVECEARVAFQLCLVCQDALCEDCMARTHSKGARATHDLKLLKQSLSGAQVYCEQCHARCGDARCEYCSRALCSMCLSDLHALICPETELNQKRQQLLGDKICVECGKAADRVCETCGDRYCSVRWMGNPGCFERFHQKGKRADHLFTEFEAPAMTCEILELEEKVKLKRKKDTEDAEVEAKKLAAAMLALAANEEEERKKKTGNKNSRNSRKKGSLKKSDSSRRRLMGDKSCSVDRCGASALGEGVMFCVKHFTLQHALEATKQDPLEAAKLLAQIEKKGGKLPPVASTLFGSKLLGSLLLPGPKAATAGTTSSGDSNEKSAAKAKKRSKRDGCERGRGDYLIDGRANLDGERGGSAAARRLPRRSRGRRACCSFGRRDSRRHDIDTVNAAGETPLFVAARFDHARVVQLLLEHGASVEKGKVGSSSNATPLRIAVAKGHVDVVRALMEANARLDDVDSNARLTVLYEAARNGHTEMARVLIEYGAKLHVPNRNEQTPLYASAHNGHTDVMRLLLERGDQVDRVNTNNVTPLWIAALKGRLEAVKLLIAHGANVDAEDVGGITPLWIAAQEGRTEVVCELLQQGGSNANNGHTAIVKELIAHGAQVDAVDRDGRTPLYIVRRDGYLGIAKVLLANHASVDGNCVIATDGLTPLFVAARNGHTGVVLALLSQQARANVKDPETGMTPLQVASQRDYTDVLRALVTKGGAEIEAADDDGDTALHAAARSGSADAVKALMKLGARVDATNILGESPLYIACGNGHLTVTKALLAKRVSATLSTVNGDTPLHAASRNGHAAIASELLASHIVADVLNHRKRTPLYEASANGCVAVVNLLLGNGGDRLLATDDGNGDTPLIAASRGGHLSIALALVKAGASTHTANLAGETAALVAGSSGHFEVARELVKSGASVHVRAATLSEYGPQMHEFKTLWDSVVKRLRSVYNVFEQQVTESVSNILAAVMDQYLMILFRFVRMKFVWEKRNFFTRLVASRNAASIFQDFHVEIDHLERRVCGATAFQATPSQSDWRHQWESDRENLTDIFWDIVNDDDRLSSNLLGHDADVLEAILLLLYEINAHNNQCTKRKLGLLEFSIKKLTSHVSSAMAPVKLPKWFLPRHELDLEHPNSHARSQESTYDRSKPFSGKWLSSNVLIRECRLTRDAVAGFGDIWFQLSHPNVIKVYGVYHLREPFLVVFENAPATSLRAHLAESRGSIAYATPQWIWQKLYEVALGLKYLHDRGIVLGKVQCDNVWIGTDGLAKIAECGLESYDLASVDEPNDLRWVAPERLEGSSPTTASDVYSLGICIIEAFTGTSPWQGQTNRKVKSLITWGLLLAQPKQLKKAQWALVNKMCLFDPLKREKLVTIVEHLKQFATASTIAATNDPQAVIAAIERSYQEKSVNFVTAFDLAGHVFPELGSSINTFLAKLERKFDQCHDAHEYVACVHARLTNIYVWLQQGTNVASEVAVAKFCQALMSFDHFLGVAVSQDSVVRQAKSHKVSLSNSVLHREIDELMGFLSMDQVDPVHEWNSSGNTGSSSNQIQLRSIAESESDSLQSDRGAQHATDEMVKFVHFESKHINQKFAPMKTSSFESTDANAGDDNSVEVPPPLWFIPLYDLKFEKEDCLGRGAFGEVYRGAWLSTSVVVKMMGYEDDDTGSTQTMFLHELRVWFPLNHPHVVKLFGACHIGKRFFVCEYAANGTLRNFLTRHGEGDSQNVPSASMTWQTLYEVTLGLQYLHDLNIVHNDLKCDNFLVSVDGKAKITDFGLSCLSDMTEIQVDLKKLGAQQWKSPEYLRGERSTLASDVYSFGMSILEAVTGTLPWGSMSDVFVRRNVRRGVLPSCPDAMSARQWNLIEMMCANELSHRLRISTVVERLQELVQHEMAAVTVKEVPLAPHGQRIKVSP